MPASGAVACFWEPDPRPSTSSPLDDDDESEDVDVDLEDEGAAGEAITRGSVAAEADWISRKTSSSLSGSNARGNFGIGATGERGGAAIVGISKHSQIGSISARKIPL